MFMMYIPNLHNTKPKLVFRRFVLINTAVVAIKTRDIGQQLYNIMLSGCDYDFNVNDDCPKVKTWSESLL